MRSTARVRAMGRHIVAVGRVFDPPARKWYRQEAVAAGVTLRMVGAGRYGVVVLTSRKRQVGPCR